MKITLEKNSIYGPQSFRYEDVWKISWNEENFFFLIIEMFSQLPSTGHRFPGLLSRKIAFCITVSIRWAQGINKLFVSSESLASTCGFVTAYVVIRESYRFTDCTVMVLPRLISLTCTLDCSLRCAPPTWSIIPLILMDFPPYFRDFSQCKK